MEPALSTGSLAVVVPPPAEIEPGMVITMVADGRLVTHRVVEVRPDGFPVTQGDANNTPDKFTNVTVVGQVMFTIPKLGFVIPAAQPSGAIFSTSLSGVQQVRVADEWAAPDPSPTPTPDATPTPTPTPEATPTPTPEATPTPTPIPTPTPTPDLTPPDECAALEFDQVLVGTEGDDIIGAGNGGALVFGLGGNDTLTGGNGKDCLVGQAGDDTIVGGNGRDVLLGGDGNDILRGDGENDIIEGGNGRDVLDGGDGEDNCLGSAKDRYVDCEDPGAAPVPVPAT
jgi:RTX calcium-binding nonapeptide repeat (4 copies)